MQTTPEIEKKINFFHLIGAHASSDYSNRLSKPLLSDLNIFFIDYCTGETITVKAFIIALPHFSNYKLLHHNVPNQITRFYKLPTHRK